MQPPRAASLRKKRDGNTVATVHKLLHSMIIEFQLRPGERLNEMQLSEQLGVGRTPLREAINRLLIENLLCQVAQYEAMTPAKRLYERPRFGLRRARHGAYRGLQR